MGFRTTNPPSGITTLSNTNTKETANEHTSQCLALTQCQQPAGADHGGEAATLQDHAQEHQQEKTRWVPGVRARDVGEHFLRWHGSERGAGLPTAHKKPIQKSRSEHLT